MTFFVAMEVMTSCPVALATTPSMAEVVTTHSTATTVTTFLWALMELTRSMVDPESTLIHSRDPDQSQQPSIQMVRAQRLTAKSTRLSSESKT